MTTPTTTASKVLDTLAADRPGQIERLIDWLKIPSISTDPAYRDHTRRAAAWAAEHLCGAGLKVELMETGGIGTDGVGSGHPVVLGTANPDAPGPHILFYGHYDVQPADPLELWESGPFEPVIRPAEGEVGERIVARGACDDKGQVATFLEALRAWYGVTGKPAGGVRMTVLLEGEEESGSVNLDRFLEQHADRFRSCDACLISDTGMLGRERPAITYGVRGLVYTEVRLHGANQDLHSGLWGGRAPNPNNELAKVLARLWDGDRRVTIPGFYDDVRPISAEERAAWSRLGCDAGDALSKIGLGPEADEPSGEAGFSAIEREWARPTADINGLFGGYAGAGAKTVIPAWAGAKVSFRLVADQSPAKVEAAFFEWCRARTPAGCRWEFVSHSGGNPATVRTDSELLKAAAEAVRRATGVAPAMIKSGGSIPVAGTLKSLLGLETIFMGFGLDDDRVHSPNEKFELRCFEWGARSHALFIDALRRKAGVE
ncbi:MAG: M20/M25/M40 family metallo-hydrolase [Phycisphaeraceae bacterium]|nr:M20/M25/M40 family metallo-hydrolase [Phycisphaeraceae bacterium]